MTKPPWLLHTNEFVPFADTLPRPSYTPILPATYGESDLHAATLVNRQNEITPPNFNMYPVGTWAIQQVHTEHYLYQLQYLPLRKIIPTETPANHTIAKYAHWLKEGYTPPPIRVIETHHFQYRITDGHHRYTLIKQRGISHIYAWVSMSLISKNSSGSLNSTGLTRENAILLAIRNNIHIPREVIHEALNREIQLLQTLPSNITIGEIDPNEWCMLNNMETSLKLIEMKPTKLSNYEKYVTQRTELGNKLLTNLT